MSDPVSGELPLHPHASDASTFSYGDYWKSLATLPPSSATAHQPSPLSLAPSSTSSPTSSAVHIDAQETSSAEVSAGTATPTRVIHAATSAYRLRLSLSPNRKPPVSTPLSQRRQNTQRPKWEGKASTREGVPRAATHLSRRSTQKENTYCHDTVAEADTVSPHRDRCSSPDSVSSFEWSSSDKEVRCTHSAASDATRQQQLPAGATAGVLPRSTTARDSYVLDAQVLQAVRCYEEWRRCLGAADGRDNASRTLDATESFSNADRSDGVTSRLTERLDPVEEDEGRRARASQEQIRTKAVEQKSPVASKRGASGEVAVELSALPVEALSRASAHDVRVETTTQAALPEQRRHRRSLSLLIAMDSQRACSFASPASSSDAARDGTDKSSRGQRNETHGLTNVQTERRGGGDSSSPPPFPAATTAGSPSPSVWWRWDASVLSSSAASPLAPQPDDSLPHVSCLLDEVHDRAEVAEHLRLRARPPPMADETSEDARTPPPPSSVQRRLFAEGDEEEDETEAGRERSRVNAAGETRNTTATCSFNEDAANGADVCRLPRFDPPLVETVVELSCSSSSRSDSCGGTAADSDGIGVAIAPEDCTESLLQEEETLLRQSPISAALHNTVRSTLSSLAGQPDGPPQNGWDRQPSQHRAVEVSRTAQEQLCEHPLYLKHRAAVSALYSARLLESEKQNEELQLFLCWAQEKAERRGCRRRSAQTHASQKMDAPPGRPRATPADEAPLLPANSSVAATTEVPSSTAFTTSATVRQIWRNAYTRCLGPRFPCGPSTSSTCDSSGSNATELPAPRGSPYATPPCVPAVYVAPPTPSNSTAPAVSALPNDDAQWLTPSSANARFIAWISNDVDVYEDLLQ
ncbi:hypothetical protein ABB37_02660 [Leptomonas pyrrhocoris]|uniref:Uncharacterized protein n=1 Tax=Leptomonas pyrrhocoris TaxID=157538 RepID=A0A0N0VG68_LEPPY|nr:hypothetical protein ABB37_02660 [Leptomonas pyrrhocoris]KPA82904.1 hypothetical protein ABB37_02660 [Leptomonas pyrrhocoris]|eukprot:XP_015661343.1 hypothetical protein ABB37_02660 [Leptomonas pyrrhocoris]